jgi:hypothetical protein
MSCCHDLEVLDAGEAALEGGLHGRLYDKRRGGGGGLALRSFGWRGAGGGSSWSWRRYRLLPDRVPDSETLGGTRYRVCVEVFPGESSAF